jgi:hypothetical protein
MVTRREKPRAEVNRELAFMHAQLAARRTWAGDVADLQDWGTAEFDPDPLMIKDINGEPLFYEFTARVGRREGGRIRAAASELVGSPVLAMEQGPRRWDPKRAVEMATAAAKKAYPREEITETELVAYSYPKIGVRVRIGQERGRNLIFDAADGTQVLLYNEEALEGQSAWSYLESMEVDEQKKRTTTFKEATRELEVARERSPLAFAKSFTPRELSNLRRQLVIASDYLIIPFISSRVLRFGPRCTSHPCFELYAQQTNVFCAVATGQMILDFYRRHFSQDDIATAMSTGAGGTSHSGQENGYESLSNGCLDAGHDYSPSWAKGKAEIDANRPFKSGIPGHARACAGWQRQNLFWLPGGPRRWLQIYDPWPWNADICAGGSIYWEDWEAQTHTNFCYVRHSTTQHA